MIRAPTPGDGLGGEPRRRNRLAAGDLVRRPIGPADEPVDGDGQGHDHRDQHVLDEHQRRPRRGEEVAEPGVLLVDGSRYVP
jgi:hypothetical protein